MTQTPFGETFRFDVRGAGAATDLGFTLADPAAPRLDLTVSAVARPQVLAFAPKAPNGAALLV
ncbi:MAG: alpha/beta hydrolase, partial [Caulobacter sp.]|nr:alpha/beta hydrolase [Caulobacter sp.]